MRHLRLALAGAILGAAMVPAVASAAPPVSFVLTLDCTDGNSYDINFGAPKNAGTALFVLGGNRILTSNYFLWTINDQVIIDSTRGLQGLGDQDLVTCVGTADVEGDIYGYTIRGWFTPRH